MSEFIRVEIDMNRCGGIEGCGRCMRVCPVNVFDRENDKPLVVEENQDECILCDLCLQECKSEAIVIHRLYDE